MPSPTSRQVRVGYRRRRNMKTIFAIEVAHAFSGTAELLEPHLRLPLEEGVVDMIEIDRLGGIPKSLYDQIIMKV